MKAHPSLKDHPHPHLPPEGEGELQKRSGYPRVTSLLLNIGHGIDHMFLLIFATAVTTPSK